MNIIRILSKLKYYFSSAKRIKQWIMLHGLYNVIYPFFLLLKIDKKKIVLCNYYGAGYGDNPKYIAEELLKQGKYKLVWLIDIDKCKNIDSFPTEIKLVPYYSFSALFELATSKFWIDNCRKFIAPPKKKKQIYIQTWHGSFNYKKVEKDALELDRLYKKKAINDSRMIDYMISDCSEKTSVYRRSFWYDGAILEIGSPRCDVFNKSNEIPVIKEKLGLEKSSYVILYAPTFRDDKNLDVYNLNYESLISAFKMKYNKNISFLIRLHPNLFKLFDKLSVPEYVKNVSIYPDMQELLLITDTLITDYSGSPFDFILTKKPIYLYVPDLVHYLEEERGLNFSPQELPFEFALTQSDLINKILYFNESQYISKIDYFLKRYGFIQNKNSSECIVRLLNSFDNEVDKVI